MTMTMTMTKLMYYDLTVLLVPHKARRPVRGRLGFRNLILKSTVVVVRDDEKSPVPFGRGSEAFVDVLQHRAEAHRQRIRFLLQKVVALLRTFCFLGGVDIRDGVKAGG